MRLGATETSVSSSAEAVDDFHRGVRWAHLPVSLAHPGMSERERQVMKKLKEVVDKQRDEIRAKDRELGLKNEDVEAVSDTPNLCPPSQPVGASQRPDPPLSRSLLTLAVILRAPWGVDPAHGLAGPAWK